MSTCDWTLKPRDLSKTGLLVSVRARHIGRNSTVSNKPTANLGLLLDTHCTQELTTYKIITNTYYLRSSSVNFRIWNHGALLACGGKTISILENQNFQNIIINLSQ